MNPEGEFSDVTSDNEVEEVIEHKKGLPIGSAAVFIIAGVCLVVVFWFIYTIWNTPDPAPAPVVETPVEEEAAYVDPTVVPGRDPNILGLRIDAIIGRLFVDNNGQTLYVNDGDCTATCLEEWTPYRAETAIEIAGPLGTTERTDDGTLQYTWQGQGLYTYKMDTNNSVRGDGHSNTWQVARP